jgi:hypothetical protein
MGVFVFATASRPSLGPTQPRIQWVAGDVTPGANRPGREAGHYHLVPNLRMRGTIPPLPNTSSRRDA